MFTSRRLFSFVMLSPPLENITDEGITSTRCKLVKSSSPLFVISRVTFNSSCHTPSIGISEILSTTSSGELKKGFTYRL